jgi:chromate reductase
VPDTVTIAAFAGSLRKGSFNRMLLRAAIELAPADVKIDAFDIDDVPMYNADLDDDGVLPAPVKRLRDAIRSADALLVVSPENNYSLPAATKNVLDWASTDDIVLDGKPAAVMGASPGQFGTTRMQVQMRQVAVATNMLMINEPKILVAHCREKFDAEGRLTDEHWRKAIPEMLDALASFARRLKAK